MYINTKYRNPVLKLEPILQVKTDKPDCLNFADEPKNCFSMSFFHSKGKFPYTLVNRAPSHAFYKN